MTKYKCIAMIIRYLRVRQVYQISLYRRPLAALLQSLKNTRKLVILTRFYDNSVYRRTFENSSNRCPSESHTQLCKDSAYQIQFQYTIYRNLGHLSNLSYNFRLPTYFQKFNPYNLTITSDVFLKKSTKYLFQIMIFPR